MVREVLIEKTGQSSYFVRFLKEVYTKVYAFYFCVNMLESICCCPHSCNREEVWAIDTIVSLLVSVIAGVICHIICKWLDRRNKQ